MHKSTSLMATLTAVFFCPMTCVSASSDSILSAGLMSVSSDYAVFSFEKWAELTDQSSKLALMDYPAHEALSSYGVDASLGHSDYVLPVANGTIEENLWRQTPASVSDYSFNLDAAEQDYHYYTQATSRCLLQSYHSAFRTRHTCEGM